MENTREQFEIKDKDLEKLVEDIYCVSDQPYWDVTAKAVSELILDYIKIKHNF